MLTAAEVRGSARLYHEIKALMNQPLPDDTRRTLQVLLLRIELDCQEVTETSCPSRWACLQVGSVLAAAVGAASYMREKVGSENAALRIFGLTGERAFTTQAAWAMVEPHLWSWGEAAVAKIRHDTALRLRLPEEPTAVDVLEELTRPRGGFAVQVGHWLAEYFRDNSAAQTDYAKHYRKILSDITAVNGTGEMAQVSSAFGMTGSMSREDWEALVHGRIPQSRLELRAGYGVARDFITTYWQKWNAKKAVAPR